MSPARGQPPGAADYHGQPLLKPPVWTWEVPAYFFVGGAAGAAAVIGWIARARHAPADLVSHARWLAALGGAASPLLLISDLGRPERFLNMLRVLKPQSPMSVGAWTLVVFTHASAAAACTDLAARHTGSPVRRFGKAAELVSAATGAVLATYTGVLLGATAIPVWSRHACLLPVHFGASGLATAAAALELLGHRERALTRLTLGAAAVETVLVTMVEAGGEAHTRPLRRGRSGALTRMGGLLAGPVPLVLRLLRRRSRPARQLAAFATVLGSALTRAGWVEAGREMR